MVLIDFQNISQGNFNKNEDDDFEYFKVNEDRDVNLPIFHNSQSGKTLYTIALLSHLNSSVGNIISKSSQDIQLGVVKERIISNNYGNPHDTVAYNKARIPIHHSQTGVFGNFGRVSDSWKKRRDMGGSMSELNSIDPKKVLINIGNILFKNKQDDYILSGNYVLLKKEYFESLRKVEEQIEEALDEYMYQIALERKDDPANIPLSEVINGFNLDIDNIMKLVDTLEEE